MYVLEKIRNSYLRRWGWSRSWKFMRWGFVTSTRWSIFSVNSIYVASRYPS